MALERNVFESLWIFYCELKLTCSRNTNEDYIRSLRSAQCNQLQAIWQSNAIITFYLILL